MIRQLVSDAYGPRYIVSLTQRKHTLQAVDGSLGQLSQSRDTHPAIYVPVIVQDKQSKPNRVLGKPDKRC